MATAVHGGVAAGLSDTPAIRRIGLADLRRALSDGADDFLATPTQLIFLALIYPVIGLIAARMAWGGNMLHLIYPLFAGITLMGPVAAVGIYDISRRRELGEPTSWLDALRVVRSPAIVSIALLGLVLLAIFALWLLAANLVYRQSFGGMTHATPGALLRDLADTPAGWRMILVGNAVGAVFAVVVLAISVVSFPMILDRGVEPGIAVRTSLRAVVANPVTMAVWGVIVAVALLIGCLSFFVGLSVVMPTLGHATWHLYRRVVAW